MLDQAKIDALRVRPVPPQALFTDGRWREAATLVLADIFRLLGDESRSENLKVRVGQLRWYWT